MAGLVKHYQNSMQGIPQLGNTWGSMIRLLDAVLVNGFNHVPILGLTKANAESITATINLGSSHGFIDRQVVRIAGSTNGWNGDYKVLSADGASITVECTTEHQSVILGTATCFTAPADFEIVHQTPNGSTEPKRAYRSTNPESLGLILLVHDFCVSGAAATGAKFAKVGIVDDMSDIDTIIGNQMPFDAINPNANWGWDGTNHGWVKWYYKVGNYTGGSSTTISDKVAPIVGNSNFCIVSDGSSIALNVLISNYESYSNYGFLEFDDVRYVGKNACLLAFGFQYRMPESIDFYAEARNALIAKSIQTFASGSGESNMHGMVWFDANGYFNPLRIGPMLHRTHISATGASPQLINTPHHIVDEVILTNNALEPIGILPFFRTTTRNQNAIEIDLRMGKYASFFRSSLSSMCTKNVMMLEVK